MTRVLIVWEDENFQTLAGIVKRRITALAPDAAQRFPEVLHHTAYGHGSFDRYVGRTWRVARASGTPTSPGPIDHLLCVVDGDRLPSALTDVEPAPVEAGEIGAWHTVVEARWQEHLRAARDASSPPETIHGRLLRWSKESLLLAGYDCAPLRERMKIDTERAELRTFLASCVPAPPTVRAASFSDTFRKPLRCINEMRAAIGLGEIKKNAIMIDDVLKELARDHHRIVSERAPDLDEIAALVWRLSSP